MLNKKKRDLGGLKSKVGGLLSPEELEATTSMLTQNTSAPINITPPSANERKKFTTMMRPDMSQQLKLEALQQGKSAADLLEEILMEYFNKTT